MDVCTQPPMVVPQFAKPKLAKTVSTLDELVKELHKVFASDDVDVDHVTQLMLSYKSNPAEWRKYAKFDRYRYTRNLVDSGNGKFNLMVLCWGEGHASAIHDHADAHCFMKMLRGELEEVRYAWPAACDPNVIKTPSDKVCCSLQGKQCVNGQGHVVEAENPTSGLKNGCCNGSGGPTAASDSCCENGDQKSDNVVEKESRMLEMGRHRLETNGVCYINDSLGLHRVENPSNVDPAVSLHLYCPPFDACHVFNQQTGRKTKCSVTFWSKFGQKRNREIQDNRAPEDN